jgi:hypothetical protein
VELVERLAALVHLVVVLPRLGDHHQHRVRQRPAAHVQQLEHLVEGRGVRRAVAADREQPVEVAGNHLAGQQRLAGAHPVAVALDGVDLAVVRDEPERVRQRPAGERVGGEPGVHDRHRGGQPLVGQVGEERVELLGREHALVDDRARRQRREVDVGLPLGALAQAERHPLQGHADQPTGRTGDEELAEARHRAARGVTQQVGVDRQVPPADDPQLLLGGDLLDAPLGLLDGLVGAGDERRAGGIAGRGRQVEVADLAEEPVGDLQQDAGAVSGVLLRAVGAAVVEVAQRRQRLHHDLVAGPTSHGGHEGDPTRVVLVLAVVQPLGRRDCSHGAPHPSS